MTGEAVALEIRPAAVPSRLLAGGLDALLQMAIFTMLLNGKGKRIGDLLAGTVVVQERIAVQGGQVAMMPPQLSAWAATTDLSGLSNDLALSARQFLARAGEMTPQAREDLGGRLVAAVVAAITPPPPAGTPGWAVLSAVLAERRRREEARLGAPPVGAMPSWGTTHAYGPTPPAGPTPSYGPPPSYGPTPYFGSTPVHGSAPPVPPGPQPRPITEELPPATGPGGFVAPS